MDKLLTLASLAGLALLAQTGTSARKPDDKEPEPKVDAAVRKEVIDTVLAELEKAYVFPDVVKKMDEAIRARQDAREYDGITDGRAFAETLTKHLQEVSRDKHLRIEYVPEGIPKDAQQTPSAEDDARFRRMAEARNYGFVKVERLPGNIGYVDLRAFMPPGLAGPTATAAMDFLANTDALIIDLRKNGGGDPNMVAYLTTYLYGPETVHLNDLYWRPVDETHQFWTLPHVPGRRFGPDKPVYVLTSGRTFSGAEEFTYNLKNLKRATIVGETTGGGAHPGGGARLSEHFSAFIPSGRAINPISKTNWEGTGVEPDVKVTADQALDTAQVMALKKLGEAEAPPFLTDERRDRLAELEKTGSGRTEVPSAGS